MNDAHRLRRMGRDFEWRREWRMSMGALRRVQHASIEDTKCIVHGKGWEVMECKEWAVQANGRGCIFSCKNEWH